MLFNAFSADPCIVFVQQQKQYYKMTMGKIVDFFKIFHLTEKPVCKQFKQEAVEKREHNQANQEKDTADKKYTVADLHIFE